MEGTKIDKNQAPIKVCKQCIFEIIVTGSVGFEGDPVQEGVACWQKVGTYKC